ncbi:hypothetical protein AAG747_16145 [Rapidithrix thailandica]|uniref:Viral A-type inclusion protein n=1 Tax=Rapidithrix thailandica TaxID=413964 RepID=A0AAW9SCD6_9BACT
MKHLQLTHVLLLCLFAVFTSCEKQNENETLHKEVMEIHDDAMAKMGTLQELSTQLENIITEKIDSTDTPSVEKARNLILSLQKADAEMMDWMKAYKEPAKETPAEEVKTYLLSEKEKITEVQTLTNNSIQAAEEFISQYP